MNETYSVHNRKKKKKKTSEVDSKSHPNHKTICKLIPAKQGKTSFCQWNNIGCINHSLGKAQEWLANTKWTLWVFVVVCFLFFVLGFHMFCFHILNFIFTVCWESFFLVLWFCFVLCFAERVKEHEVEWVRRWGKIREELGEGKE